MRRKFIGAIFMLALFAFTSVGAFAKEETVRGKLQRTVESGGWLIVSLNQKYLLLNSQRFQNQDWFREANEVEAVGETRDAVSIYMEGTPFEVKTMRPVSSSGSTAQTGSRELTKVMVVGDSIVQAKPDTATLHLAVVTQAKRAIDAQQENATKSEAVVRALKNAAGAGAEVKTSGYTIQPMRVYREGQPPSITGYEARNSVMVVMSDLTKIGPVIDAASAAGVNDIGGISFTLRNDRPTRDQALSEATREALGKAQVIARALGGRVVRIVEVVEEGVQRPRPVYDEMMQMRGAVAAAATPIEVGNLDITARVQLVAEIEAGAR